MVKIPVKPVSIPGCNKDKMWKVSWWGEDIVHSLTKMLRVILNYLVKLRSIAVLLTKCCAEPSVRLWHYGEVRIKGINQSAGKKAPIESKTA